MFSFLLLRLRSRNWRWLPVDRRGEHLGGGGHGHLGHDVAQPVLLQRAERLGLGGVVGHGRLVTEGAGRPGGALGFSRLAGATQ